MSRSNDIILLLGAGASIEAGIPGSQQMIENIEKKLCTPEWRKFQDLYNLVKSSISYAAGISGQFNLSDFYNVECLVSTLDELAKREKHPIYPFISDWKSHLIRVAEHDFRQIHDFRARILDELKGWVQPPNENDADYYSGLKRLQAHLNYPLKVFSLNYDLCVERCGEDDFRIESGFEQKGKTRVWDWRRFDESNPNREPTQIYLYKMHGSIDWKRDENDNLIKTDDKGARTPGSQLPLIFGTDRKMEAGDPYLFYAYEFRRCALDCKLILCIGYGFGDGHINKMIKQGLRADPRARVAVVSKVEKSEVEERNGWIAARIGVPSQRIQIVTGSAQSFLENPQIGTEISKLVPRDEGNVPF